MSKSKLNKVLLVHPNTYNLIFNDSFSSVFLNRKLLPIFISKHLNDYNKWLTIREELNKYINNKRRRNPSKSLELNNNVNQKPSSVDHETQTDEVIQNTPINEFDHIREDNFNDIENLLDKENTKSTFKDEFETFLKKQKNNINSNENAKTVYSHKRNHHDMTLNNSELENPPPKKRLLTTEKRRYTMAKRNRILNHPYKLKLSVKQFGKNDIEWTSI